MSNYNANKLKETVRLAQRDAIEHLGQANEVAQLRESFGRIVSDVLSLEDEGWSLLSGFAREEAKGFSLDDVQETTKYAERQVKTNNLLGRGLRLKNNYVVGRGFTFDRADGAKVKPAVMAIINDPENQEVLFSPTAVKELNRIAFTSGNIFVTYNKETKKFDRLAVDLNIENYISYDSNPSRIKYFLRTYEVRNDLSKASAKTVTKREWIPSSTYALAGNEIPDNIPVGGDSIPVNKNLLIIDLRLNADNGEVWGVPDCFSALPWAWAATEYLKDGSKLAKSIAAIAFHVRAKTLEAAKSAGAKMQTNRVGQAAITGPDTEITQIPRAGAIDMYEGRPLQAAVATALDVSVAAITADTARGGSYASETALSQPEQLSALARQEDFTGFFSRVFAAMGAKEMQINFARVDLDPIHRRLQSLGIARTLGGINQREFRIAALELLDVKPTDTKLPEPDEFTGSKASTLADYLVNPDGAVSQGGDPGDPIAARGNKGAVGSLDDGNDARDSDDAGAFA